MSQKYLKSTDKDVYEILKAEEKKQQEKLSMIPSENFASKAVREAVGSVFMNKYSEGYPNARYYEGNYHIDKLELLAIKRAKKFFNLPEDWEVNVQALSGSCLLYTSHGSSGGKFSVRLIEFIKARFIIFSVPSALGLKDVYKRQPINTKPVISPL